MTVKRMDNIGIVVEDLDTAIAFFTELDLELEGSASIEGEWAGRVTGLGNQHVEIAMLRTPDSHSRIELSRFLAPPVVADHRTATANAVRRSSAKWSSTKIHIGSATSGVPKEFLSGLRKSLGSRILNRHM